MHSNYDLEFYVHDFPFKDTESLSEVSTHSGHHEGWRSFQSSWAFPPHPSPPGVLLGLWGGWFGWVWFLPPSLFLAPRGVGFPFWGGFGVSGPGFPNPPSSLPRVPGSFKDLGGRTEFAHKATRVQRYKTICALHCQGLQALTTAVCAFSRALASNHRHVSNLPAVPSGSKARDL